MPQPRTDLTGTRTGPGPARAGSAVADTRMLTVRYFASARAAAGLGEESLPAPVSLAQLLAVLADRHGSRLASVLAVSSYLIDGVVRHERTAEIAPGSTVDILPPFAGG